MATTTTTIHALPAPDGNELVKDGDNAIKALADAIDPKLSPPASGTLASRPTSTSGTPGKLGRTYYATDEGVLYYDYGTGWIPNQWQPGDIRFTARGTLDTGFLACDGAAISRSTYAALFAAIGTAYGVGNGTTTFNLPDYRGRGPLGAGTGTGLTARTVGQSIGEESHLLTAAESGLPAHVHTTQGSTTDPGGTNGTVPSVSASGGVNDVSLGAGALVNTAANASSAHNNMQPSAVCNVWIKS